MKTTCILFTSTRLCSSIKIYKLFHQICGSFFIYTFQFYQFIQMIFQLFYLSSYSSQQQQLQQIQHVIKDDFFFQNFFFF